MMTKLKKFGNVLATLFGLLLVGLFLFVFWFIPPQARSVFVREIVAPGIVIIPLILLWYAIFF